MPNFINISLAIAQLMLAKLAVLDKTRDVGGICAFASLVKLNMGINMCVCVSMYIHVYSITSLYKDIRE